MRAVRKKLRAGAAEPGLTARRREVHSLHFTINQVIKNGFSVWVVIFFIAAVGWRELPYWLTLGWIVFAGAMFTWRSQTLQAGRELAMLDRAPERWRNVLNATTVLCGLVAGAAPLVIFPWVGDSARMYLTMIYCSWLAAAMSSLGARPGLYAAYGAILALGVALAWLVSGSDNKFEVFAMLLVFVAVTTGFSRSFAAQIHEGIEIRYANQQLVEGLQVARAAAEDSSAAKSRFLAVASHDLRQPLHAVTLLNGLLVRPQTVEKIA